MREVVSVENVMVYELSPIILNLHFYSEYYLQHLLAI